MLVRVLRSTPSHKLLHWELFSGSCPLKMYWLKNSPSHLRFSIRLRQSLERVVILDKRRWCLRTERRNWREGWGSVCSVWQRISITEVCRHGVGWGRVPAFPFLSEDEDVIDSFSIFIKGKTWFECCLSNCCIFSFPIEQLVQSTFCPTSIILSWLHECSCISDVSLRSA